MFITEQNTNQWTQIIKENLGVTDQNKVNWMAEYAARHEIKENLAIGGQAYGVQGTAAGGQAVVPAQGAGPMYATPLNTTGMGNPAAPSPLSTTSTAPADFFAQKAGSGDIPVSTLPMSLNIALMTIGFDLVPVIPAKGPWTLLTYLDFPYAGGKLGRKNEIAGLDGEGTGRENKPLYFKVLLDSAILPAVSAALTENIEVAFKADKAVARGYFKTLGRMDAGVICEVIDVTDVDSEGGKVNTSLKAVFTKGIDAIEIGGVAVENLDAAALAKSRVDFAQTQVDFIDGFANFATGKKEAMTRAQNETGTGNTIGLRLFSKWVQMGSYEVTGQVTRQQLQDLPLYGVDAVATVMEAMQNEISQSINARILEYYRALGVTNAVKAKLQGVDLNLHMGTGDTTMAAITGVKSFVDVNGFDHKASWGVIKNAEVNTSAENLSTRQRRIASRILAASQYIAVTGRRGKATHAIVGAQIAAALIDNSAYVVNPIANTLSQTNQGLYKAGTLAGIEIYVDPYMDWNDTSITVLRKTNGKEPGLVFMPYILADTVSITAEGTMAPKMLVNSRYALTPIGFYPEASVFTFVVDSPEFGII